eukprot:snap_masked-scaffold_20-processed-gene-1.22-mRNA-1 protein AED:0.09 eAED:0.09 QI:0/-1/0/1/-1/1/1/0/244
MDFSILRQRIEEHMNIDPELCPLFIRFSWHCSGTYNKEKGNGGSNGFTMQFAKERSDDENRGFDRVFPILEELRNCEPKLSYSDLSVLLGTVSISWSGGPFIQFKTGRADLTKKKAKQKYGKNCCPFEDGDFNPNGSRLPAADLGTNLSEDIEDRENKTISHVRNTFDRLGFNDKKTVCLILLGHQYGQCHSEVSGYDGFWYPSFPFDWKGGRYARVYNKEFEEVFNMTTRKRQFEHNPDKDRN